MKANPLLRHDCQVIAAEFAVAFAALRDRLLLALMAILAVAALRSAENGSLILSLALAVGVLVGATAQRLLAGRLRFHATETLLAAHALTLHSALAYLASFHVAAVFLLVLAAAIVSSLVAATAAIGYAVGAVIEASVKRLRLVRPTKLGMRAAKRWRNMPLASAAAAPIPILLELGAGWLSELVPGLVVLGVATVAILLFLGRVDEQAARFDALVGRSTGKSLLALALPSLAFIATELLLVVPLGLTEATLVALIGAGAVVLLTVQTCLYRAYPKRAADLLLTGGLLSVTLIGTLWWLLALACAAFILAFGWRRSAQAVWLMP